MALWSHTAVDRSSPEGCKEEWNRQINVFPQQFMMYAVTKECSCPDLDGHFVLGEGSAPKQLIDAVNGEEPSDVGA